MSNITLPDEIPAYLAKTELPNDDFLGGIGSGNFLPKLSIRGRRFRIVDGDEEVVLRHGNFALESINVAIVAARPTLSKAYYEHEYEAGEEITAPTCMSLDSVSPDPSVTNPVSSSCVSCPKNAFGTAKRGKGKACSDFKRLIVVPCDEEGHFVEWKGRIQAFRLDVPAASLKNFRSYVAGLTKRGVPVAGVVTEVRFEEAEFPLLGFGFAGFLIAESAAIVPEIVEDPAVQAEISIVAAGTPVLEPRPAPKTQRSTELPAPALEPEPTPEPAAVVRDVTPEPAPARGGFSEEDLEDMPLNELRAMAAELGLEDAGKRRRSTLIPFILDAQSSHAQVPAPQQQQATEASQGDEPDAEISSKLDKLLGDW